jgi:hypothetical protein
LEKPSDGGGGLRCKKEKEIRLKSGLEGAEHLGTCPPEAEYP